MAGKEHSGIENAEGRMLHNAVWFLVPQPQQDLKQGKLKEFRELLEQAGLRIIVMDADRHDKVCAWISHLPQMISTAFGGMLVDEFGDDVELHAIGGRALREMTRIAASPYGLWRDIAHTNAANIEQALGALEQRLANIRENLRSPELRHEFERANKFELRKRETAESVLVLPGWHNSGPLHWQTIWEQESPICIRVQQADWDTPRREDWVKRISEEVSQAPAPIVFAAHSLGCIAVAHWAQSAPELTGKIKGALLVAPADADRADFPEQIKNFAPIPQRLLPFPSTVVASSDDPYLSLDRARELARIWGSWFAEIGSAGHIASGLGDWPEGKRLLRNLMEGV